MTPTPNASLASLPRLGQWAVLLCLSAVLAALLHLAGLPAALMLGPMIAAILAATCGGAMRVARLPYYASQTVIGLQIARAITPEIIGTFVEDWPLFLGVVLSTVLVCSLIGWAVSRLRIIPGTTAVWGLSPGAANAMVLMSEAHGADARLVGFMQYLRVVFVVLAASVVARTMFGLPGAATVRAVSWFAPIHALPFAQTLAIALVGGILARVCRIPAGGMLVPMLLGAALHGAGLVEIELPQWLLASSYAFLGWRIGLGFTRPLLVHALRVLPQTILAILAVIVFCGAVAGVLVRSLGIDPLTAYLATSPGGIDSIAIIAASSEVDVSFVMALQAVRLVVVILAGPAISRFIADRLGREAAPVAGDGLSVRLEADEDELD